MFFPRLSFIYGALAKVLFSLFVVAVTFRIRGVRLFVKTVGPEAFLRPLKNSSCHFFCDTTTNIDPYKAILQKQSVAFGVRVHLPLGIDGS